ncbi:hypothetical protein [Streptomyces cupreus]|uniref:DUF1877 family protein n=1 Tax=Streptomyces cupreus TaxID=2759956 RepID=A0A7X1M8D3_9ACTN|nr:hypothetical protein [Streptomyces cupreus]MBC2901897.1 hypothetical protein [Streptomyces cupreus]
MDTLQAMGILHDYFRAPAGSVAIDWAVGPNGDWHQHSGTSLDDHAADWFDGKGLDPHVVLGQLLAFAAAAPFDPRDVGPVLIWPDERSWPPREEEPGQESPWDTGMLLHQLPDNWVATLAAIEDEHLPLLALQWFDVPEVDFADFSDAQDTVVSFRTLARRAHNQGHGVFCKTVV